MASGHKGVVSYIVSLVRPLLCAAALARAVIFSPTPASAEETCTAIRFKPGASSAVISGAVPGHGRDDPEPARLCYSLAVSAGQNANVTLLAGRNVAITIPGVGDANDRFEFTTRRGTYQLHIFQLFPGGAPEGFRMRVEVLP